MATDFQPQFSPEDTQQYVEAYKRSPYAFTPEFTEQIEKHAEGYQIPFARDPEEYEFSLGRGVKQATEGFLSGMSTFEVGKPSANVYEQILRNLGHLAGFAGVIPAAKPLKLLGNALKSQRILNLAKGVGKTTKLSVPMIAADFAEKKIAAPIANKIIKKTIGKRGEVTGQVGKFLYDDKARDIISGAFHLGVASSVSSWQGGVDQMMDSFVHGAEAGAAFRTMGNFINTGNIKGDKMLRGMAGSLYMGLPATERGATTPEQVYEYVLGAYFGYGEAPAAFKRKREFIAKMFEEGEFRKPEPLAENVKGFEELSPEVQKLVTKESELLSGLRPENLLMSGKLMKKFEELGVEFETDQDLPEGMERVGVSESGEMMIRPKQEVAAKVDLDAKETSKKQEKLHEEIHEPDNTADSDIGTPVEVQPIGQASLNFVDRNLKGITSTEVITNPSKRLAKRVELAGEIDKKLDELSGKGKEEVLSDDFVDWFETTYKTPMSPEEKGNVRQWFLRRNHGYQPVHVSFDSQGKFRILDRTNPFTDTGKSKYQPQPRKIIEDIFLELTGDSKTPAYIIMDHVITRSQKGNPMKESDLMRFRDDIMYDLMYSKEGKNLSMEEINKRADAGYDKWFMEAAWQMWGKGYYYYGGRGDAERAYFVKTHPWLEGRNNTDINNIFKQITDIAGSKFREEVKSDKAIFEEKVKGSLRIQQKDIDSMFFKSWVSNFLYDMNMNGFRINEDTQLPNKADIVKLLGKGFIGNAIAFNKRQQIWFNNGYGGNTEFLKKNIKDFDGNYNYVLVNEESAKKLNKDSIIFDYLEKTDGAIVAREDVVEAMNKDYGMPESSFSKSFITAPSSEHGALLGKYAIHGAGEAQSEAMKKAGVHFYIYDSSAKQQGTRKKTDLKRDGSDLSFDKNLIYNDITPENMRGVLSEKNTGHMMGRQRIPKQLLTNLTAYAWSTQGNPELQKKAQAVIDDMFDSFMGEEFRGDAEWNTKLMKYMKEPTESRLSEITENLNSLGLEQLIGAMKAPGFERLNHAIYKHIMKINNELLEEAVAEGEMTKEDKAVYGQELKEFNSSTDRLLKIADDLAKEDSSSSLPVFMHKYVRDFRAQIVRNYVVNALARPKIDNSASARMRPLDAWMTDYLKNGEGNFIKENAKEFLKKGNENDRFFFLDDTYRDLKITTRLENNGERPVTLGEFFDKFNAGEYKNVYEEANEVLRAVVVRVPMDSISGAHALTFSGFTGRKGHGILLHPRVMQALGGADLDGDKANSIIFGGKTEDGHGKGFKKSWKDFYHANKDEFEGVAPERSKDKYREKLSIKEMKAGNLTLVNEKNLQNNLKGKSWYYSPFWRMQMSANAARGRQLLGPAVVTKQVMNAAHAAMAESGKPFVYTATTRKGDVQYEIEITPKTGQEEMKRLSEIGRATVAFGSDPMDELGLDRNAFLMESFKAGFNVKVKGVKSPRDKYFKKLTVKPKESIEFLTERFNGGTEWISSSQSPFGKMKGINSAYYGRNWGAGRSFYFQEIKNKAEGYRDFKNRKGEEITNTFLPKLSKFLHPLDWSDNVFDRIKLPELRELYESYDKNVRRNAKLARAMERLGFPVTIDSESNKVIRQVFNYELWDYETRKGIAYSDTKWEDFTYNTPIEKLAPKITGRGKYMKVRTYLDFSFNERMNQLDSMVRKAEDFLTNDLTDMVSLVMIDKVSKNMSEKEISRLHKLSEEIKEKSWLNAYNRKNTELLPEPVTPAEIKQRQANDLMREALGLPKVTQQRSAMADQHTLDKEIASVKKGLDANGKLLFDYLLMSSLRRGPENALERISELRDKSKKLTEKEEELLSNLERDSLRTTLTGTKTAFSSREVSDVSIRNFFREYGKLFNATSRVATAKEIDKMFKDIVEVSKPQEIEDVRDVTLERTEPDSYSGLKNLLFEGKLKPEQEKVITELESNLEFYHENIGKRLNELTRGIIKKDLNAMNFEDFKALNRFFRGLRNGRWGDQVKFADKGPLLKKIHYWLFPRAVNEELMKHNIELLEEKGYFMKADGEYYLGKVAKPSQFMDVLQKWINNGNEMAQSTYDREKDKLAGELLFLEQIPEYRELHEIAIRTRELGMIKQIEDGIQGGAISREQGAIWQDMYRKEHDNAAKKYKWETLEEKEFKLSMKNKDGKTVHTSLSGGEIVKRINKIYTTEAENMKKWIHGEGGGWEEQLKPYIKGWHNETAPIIDVNKFIENNIKMYRDGQNIPMKYGMDGLRKVAYSLMIETAESRKYVDTALIKKLRKINVADTKFLPTDVYWPHMMFDKKAASESLNAGVKSIMEHPLMDAKKKKKEIMKLQLQHKSMTGEWMSGDITDWQIFDGAMNEMANKRRDEHIKWYDSNQKTGSMFHRQSHIGGYSPDAPVMDAYIKNLSGTYYRQLSQIIARNAINKFEKRYKKKWGDNLTSAWSNFFKLYAQDSMGYPSVIPEYILENPNMNIKGTPYAWWADNNVRKRVNKILGKLNLTDKDLPEDMRGIDLQQLRHWSNLEAKYEMASLLAHPKSMFTNIYGGQMHTIQSAGMKNWLKGRNIGWLKTHLNPGKDSLGNEWSNLADVEKWVQSHGVIPELVAYEYGLSPDLQKGNFKKFFNEAIDEIRDNPNLKDNKLREIATKYKVSDAVFNKAAWFMRTSERALRRDAFMAHLAQAYERYGGAITNIDHPFLIQEAKKGVQATQFMYSAPFRPAFARTALGKVMTRFQLWAWNAVRFRGDIIDQAAIYGYREGTPEFQRFKRMMTLDMLSIAFANIFAYSLFDAALPAPYNWLQDTADWLYGDEKERDRAFFGSWPAGLAPLQLVTPPIFRLGPATFKGWVDDDWSKLIDYHIYTAFPFGRIARDIVGPGNIIENPIRTVEKVTGLPYLKFHREIRKTFDDNIEKPHPRGWL